MSDEILFGTLLEVVRNAQPATVRQIFYLASVRGIVAKDEGGYDRVQINLVEMRRSGQLPYGWLVDHTRWQRRRDDLASSGSPRSWPSVF